MVLLETLSLTGHIRTHDAPCPRRSRASRPWDRGSRRDLDELHLPAPVTEHKTVQAFPAQPVFHVVKHTVTDLESDEGDLPTHPLNGISSPKRPDFPLLVVRYTSHRLLKRTYKTPSLSESCGWSTANVSRVLLDVQVGLTIEVLDFVDPWFQSSVYEDGGVTGRVWGHGFRASATTLGTRVTPRC